LFLKHYDGAQPGKRKTNIVIAIKKIKIMS
jgi:hypothetical protein